MNNVRYELSQCDLHTNTWTSIGKFTTYKQIADTLKLSFDGVKSIANKTNTELCKVYNIEKVKRKQRLKPLPIEQNQIDGFIEMLNHAKQNEVKKEKILDSMQEIINNINISLINNPETEQDLSNVEKEIEKQYETMNNLNKLEKLNKEYNSIKNDYSVERIK
jgi:hypothetical protein